eukprot:g4758.t1
MKRILTGFPISGVHDPNLDDLLSPMALARERHGDTGGIIQTDFSFTDDFEFVNGVPAFVLNSQLETEDDIEGAKFCCYAFSQSGKHLVAGDDHGVIRIWDTRGFKELKTRTIQSSKAIGCVGFLHNSEHIVVACDVFGFIECFSYEDDFFHSRTNAAVSEIQEHCFIRDDDLAVEVAMDPNLTSSQIWPPRISEDGSTIVQAVCTRSDPGSFISNVLIFLTRVSQYDMRQVTFMSERRNLVSLVRPSPNGEGLIVAFAPSLPKDKVALGDEIRPPGVEIWPVISLDGTRPGSIELPCQMANWAKQGELIIGWRSGNKPDANANVSLWKKSTLVPYASTPVPFVSRTMELDDTIFLVELLTPFPGRSQDEILLAICFTESNETSLLVQIWDANLEAVIMQFGTITAYKDTLVGQRQYLNHPEVMGYHWGHPKWIMEQSLIKMCTSSDKMWIAFYSTESNHGYLWSVRDGVPVAKLDLPPHLTDEQWGFVSAMKSIAFDPTNTKVVLKGAQRIIALVPSFLQLHNGYQMRFINSPQGKCTTFESLSLSYTGYTLALRGHLKENNVTPVAKKFGPCILNLMEGASSQAPLGTALEESTRVAKDIAVSMDGDMVGFLFADNLVAIASASAAVLDPILNLSRFPNDAVLRTVSTSTEYIYNKLFFSCLLTGEEQLVCFSLQHKGCIVWFDTRSFEFIDRIDLSVDKCLGVKLSKKRTHAIVLSTQLAQIVDLECRELTKSIGYAVSISRARHLMFTKSSDQAQILFRDSDQYEVSDDGTMVLIGWDIARNCALYLTPETKLNDFRKYSEKVTGGLNSNVKLSCSSRWVFVAAEKQLKSSDDEDQKGICVYDRRGKISPRKLPDNLDKTGCRPLFTVSEDGRIIVARSLFRRDLNESTLSDTLIVLTPYAIEGSLPDFNRLQLTKETEEPETISKLIEEFGWPLLNSTDSEEMSIFQHALTSGKDQWVMELCELSKSTGIPIKLFWKASEGDGCSPIYRNSLQWALQWASETRSDEAVRYQLDALADHITTVTATASIIKTGIIDLYTYFPDQFIRIFETNRLVADFGQAPVALKIMSQSKDPFLVGSDSNVISWDLQTPDKVSKLWKSMGVTLASQVKRGRKRAEIQAESKFALIEDVAGIGMNGLLRRLLMMDVPVKMFNTDIVRWTVAHKWNTYGFECCLKELAEYTLLVVIFTIYAMLLKYNGGDFEELEGGLLFIPLVLAMYLGAKNLKQEYLQICRFRDDAEKEFKNGRLGVRYHLKSQWNWMELISYFLLMLPIPVVHLVATVTRYGNLALTALVAVESIIIYWKLLYFAQAFKLSGPLVVMIREIVYDILVFLCLAGMILMGFSIAFFVIYRHVDHENFGSFRNSLSTMFIAILGDFDFTDYRDADHLSWLAVMLFVIYMLSMLIVLLNLLIAIMSDTYDRVKNQDVAEFIKCRAMVLDDSEAVMSEEEIKYYEKKIGRYLHVLTPVKIHDVQDEWQGKIGALENSVNRQLKEQSEAITKQIKGLEVSINELRKQLTHE